MSSSKKLVIRTVVVTLLFVILFASVAVISIALAQKYSGSESDVASVLGDAIEKVPVPEILLPDPTVTLSPTPTTVPAAPSATGIPVVHNVSIRDFTAEVMEDEPVTFTWAVEGPSRTIRKTAVYYGIVSVPGQLSREIGPENTVYSGMLRDFADGRYIIPLQFIGSVRIPTAGIYFARAYALVDGKHYWSNEFSFIIQKRPKNTITIVDYPKTLKSGGNASFTWEINGPPAMTGFTVIAGGKESKPGGLGEAVDLPQTPYAVLVNDFTTAQYQVPYRYIGNVKLQDTGTYYFRALAYVNGKNIWSEEYSLVVE